MKKFLLKLWKIIKIISYQWFILLLKKFNKWLTLWLANKRLKKSKKLGRKK